MTRIQNGLYAHVTTSGTLYIERTSQGWVWDCAYMSDARHHRSIRAAKKAFDEQRSTVKKRLQRVGDKPIKFSLKAFGIAL